MNYLPMMTHQSLDDAVAIRQGRGVTLRQFLADVNYIRQLLRPGQHLLNTCQDRYHFMVGLAAAMVAGKTSLLPSTYTTESVKKIVDFAPDLFCIGDDGNDMGFPYLAFPIVLPNAPVDSSPTIPRLDESLPVAYVFTSGSTGIPVPHLKTWGDLVHSVRAEAQRLGLLDGRTYTVVGTVPPQHMYGFESTILMLWQCAGIIATERYFYPADIYAGISSVARPRVLISTPVHLRSMLATDTPLPSVDLLLSATAPLTRDLAVSAEARFGGELLEIYGSTETGVVATRRTSQTKEWHLLPGLSWMTKGDRIRIQGGHLQQAMAVGDAVEIVDEQHFLLYGRMEDLVNIAGKRSSISHLNHQLTSVSGVLDGVFFMPDESDDGRVTRLVAFAVAPDLDVEIIIERLKQCVDPAFIPRPLKIVDSLPRNTTGKISREALKAMVEALMGNEERSSEIL
ncbi:AMP-binding protein [Acidithiobacillus ferrivorans]|uniref:Acyl-CoA synthetase n=1 Tax=Acidithiobacillus ferrivorans TaxID=160808 RepID=A0A7T4WDA4_9PROT|nr:AMP-binding protein [Acidithiobacillus ferrivorans]MBN6739886.1 acyl-CoA synthetase [Acidithiobacillus sp. MC6.1]QQD72524.1 acyl-CoA synthetase [Acidithiobacillus ferrivorans]